MPDTPRALVFGHRGAPVFFPEHTRASYLRAIADGADFIEPDLVMTRDGIMVARHENEIGSTTDVADHPGFAGRKTSKSIDGQDVTGWFSEDFTLAELNTLRARERLPELRGTQHDGQFPLLTLDQIIELAATESARLGRVIGVIPEIKHGTYFRELGLAMEDPLLATLTAHDYTRSAPVIIQSFEITNLRYLRKQLDPARANGAHADIRLLQLIEAAHTRPFDVAAAGSALTYAHMMTPEGLRTVAEYADAIGPELEAVIPRNADDRLGHATGLVHAAHAANLGVYVYTFRPENRYLARNFRDGNAPATRNRDGLMAQIDAYLDAGIDALFSDDPGAARIAVDRRARGGSAS